MSCGSPSTRLRLGRMASSIERPTPSLERGPFWRPSGETGGHQSFGGDLEEVGGDGVPDPVPCRKGGSERGVIDDRNAELSRLSQHGTTRFAMPLADHERHRSFLRLVTQADELMPMDDRDDRLPDADADVADRELHPHPAPLAANERVSFEV